MQNDIVEQLITQIKRLEKELLQEFQKKQEKFLYRIDQNKVRFEEEARKRHLQFKQHLHRFLLESPLLNYLTAPVIWSVIFPTLILDGFVTVYQVICFPVYKIPRVRRNRYIIIDRHALGYLNLIEKINCVYCAYFNGLLPYIQEVAARTEQYWCPIKHARRVAYTHSRYRFFFDYGDAEGYRTRLEEVRRNFADLREEEEKAGQDAGQEHTR
jgi:hypothetical protein